jgi:hypothetical protein
MRTRPRVPPLALVVAVVLLAAVLPAGVAASPRPTPVVAVDEAGLQHAGDRAGVPIVVGESTARLDVTAGGDVHWTVSHELNGSAADRLAANATLRANVVRAAVGYDDASDVESRVTGETLVVEYDTPDRTARRLGALRLDTFRTADRAVLYSGLGVDRLTVVGPPGTVAARGPPGAERRGNRLVLTDYRASGDGPFAVFVPAGTAAPGAVALAVVALAVADVVARNLLLLVALPGAVFAGATAVALRVAGRRVDAARGPAAARARRRGLAVAALGLVGASHALWTGLQPLVNAYSPRLLAGAVAYVLVGVAVAVAPEGWSLPRLGGLLTGAAGAGALAVVLARAAGVVPDWGPSSPLALLVPLLPFLFTAVVGYVAVHGDRRARRVAVALPTLGLATVVLAARDVASTGGTFYGLVVLLLVAFALSVCVVGAPLVALGASLDAAGGARRGEDGSSVDATR